MFAQLSFLALLIVNVLAVIVDDLSCSTGGKYTYSATACSNNYPDAVCEALYPETTSGSGHPQSGNSAARPFLCYSATDIGSPEAQQLKTIAIANCAKTCGFCCLTPAFNCANAVLPRINCATVTDQICSTPALKDILAQDCPNVCGFCGMGPTTKIPVLVGDPGCPDTNSACATWASKGFCTSEDYTVAQKRQYCGRTCKLC